MHNCKYFVAVFLLPLILCQALFAQEIRKGTIYTSTSQRTILHFPAAVTVCDFSDDAAQSRFYKRVNNSVVSIYAKVDNAAPAVLKISDGKRDYLLTVVFKKELSFDELSYKWSELPVAKDDSKPAPLPAKNENSVAGTKPAGNLSSTASNKAVNQPLKAAKPVKEKNTDAAVAKEDDTYDYYQAMRDKENQEKYDSAIAKATSFVEREEYEQAIDYYKRALLIKPDAKLPNTMLRYAESSIPAMAKRRQREKDLKRKAHIVELLDSALKATTYKNYADAKTLYQKVLSLGPSQTQADFSNKKIETIDYALERMGGNTAPTKLVDAKPGSETKEPTSQPVVSNKVVKPSPSQNTVTKKAQEKPAAAPVSAKTPPPEAVATTGQDNSIYQKEPVPYTADVLRKKYPGIDFNDIPAGQMYDSTGKRNKSENYQLSRKAFTPFLNISDSSNQVKLTCETITFSGKNAYIKLSIKNYSPTSDFLTGPLALTYIKKGGAVQQLHPSFVSDFPVVLPGKEYTILYVAEVPPAVDPQELLLFQMEDRMKKSKFKIYITGSIYNWQKVN